MNKLLAAIGMMFLLVSCDSSSSPNENPNPEPGTSSSSSGPSPDVLYGNLPANLNQELVATMYADWIARFYRTFLEEVPEADWMYYSDFALPALKNSARILFDQPRKTVSEGIGYGLLITAFSQDWDRFDKLFNFYKLFPMAEADGKYLMMWMIDGFQSGSGESATDADLDVVTALFYAYEKTGNQAYLEYAQKVGLNIYDLEVHSDTKLLLPANSGGNLNNGYCYNISYFSPVALRYLIKYQQSERDWQTVLDKTYEYMIKVQDAGNGLWPDWSDAKGIPINPDNGSSTGKLNDFWGLEGLRIPWRLAWDYRWFGDERSEQMLKKAFQFATDITGGNVLMTLNRYKYQGEQPTGVGGAQIGGFGAFCALGIVAESDNNWLLSCNEKLMGTSLSAGTNYYHPSLQMLYLQLMNGFYVR